MHTIIKYNKLFIRYVRLSIINLMQYPFELFMKIISLTFNIVFIIVFWYSIFNLNLGLKGWSNYELIILSGMGILSNSISQLAFGFRDIDYHIINGNFDKYLIRPINPIFSILNENLFIFWVISQVISGLGLILIPSFYGEIQLYNAFSSFTILILSTIAFNLIYASVSLLAFWIGRIDNVRSLIFSVDVAKKYPLDSFPSKVVDLLTYVIPINLIVTLPTKILLNKESNSFRFIIISALLCLLWSLILYFIWKKALSKYQSTGS
ncbi:ABC transporter permease [Clostridium hydrogeniformans]|uniref:ABC transporter permease n=1 Tax=Clostridium hydrogeniformans TaxID=349933 RepID=UPI0004837299|nr:ABC-2 family transporter protein [Clostridium hydrogeniformans]